VSSEKRFSHATYQEEEEYAKFLVEEFESGLSSDLEHGSSLRAYLSKKLYCSPMRISKKFSGILSFLDLDCSIGFVITTFSAVSQ